MAFLSHAGPQQHYARRRPNDVYWMPQRAGFKRAGRWVSSAVRQRPVGPGSAIMVGRLDVAALTLPEELRRFSTGPPLQPHPSEAAVWWRSRMVEEQRPVEPQRFLWAPDRWPQISDDSGLQPGRLDPAAPPEVPVELRHFLVGAAPVPLISDDSRVRPIQIAEPGVPIPLELRRFLLVSDRQREPAKHSTVLHIHRGAGRRFTGRFVTTAIRQPSLDPGSTYRRSLGAIPPPPAGPLELRAFVLASDPQRRRPTLSFTVPRESDIGRRAGSFWKTPDRIKVRPTISIIRGVQLLPFIPPIPMPVELQRFLTGADRQLFRHRFSLYVPPQIIHIPVDLPEDLRRWLMGSDRARLRSVSWTPETVYLRPQLVLPTAMPNELRRWVMPSDQAKVRAISWRPEIGWIPRQIPTTTEPPIELRRWRFTTDRARQWHRAWMPEVGWVRVQIPDKLPRPAELFRVLETSPRFRRGPHRFEDAWFGDRFAVEISGVLVPCGLIRFKWGTKTKWGTAWKWGFGVSDPYTPCGDPPTIARFDVELCDDTTPTITGELVPDVVYTQEVEFTGSVTSARYTISNAGVVSISYGIGLANEVFYLQSPNGTWWQITANGTTGLQTVQSGISGTPVNRPLLSPNGKLWLFIISDTGILTVDPVT